METSTYKIIGMTCESCVQTVTRSFMEIPDVITAKVDLNSSSAQLVATRKIKLDELKHALRTHSKYSVLQPNESLVPKTAQPWYKTYRPLLTLFIFIILISLVYQYTQGTFSQRLFMQQLMAGFFIGLSFFKFLDLTAFANSFSSYDPLAQKWRTYGLIYPFIELSLGLMFISGLWPVVANSITILILSLTTYGVYLRLQSKNTVQCACLGTAFNLPLSKVTIFENVIMIAMALAALSGL